MRHSFLPFVLASLGFTIILLSIAMPLFEWQISEIVTDFPPIYEVHVFPPWTARFGESFDDDLYLYRKISVLKDRRECYNEDINVVFRRSQKDDALEQKWLNVYKSFSWLPGWSLIEIVLSVLYIWWFIIWYKRQSFWKAMGLTVFAGFVFLNLIPRLMGPLSPNNFHGAVDCFNSTIAFNASLSEIHYETPVILLIGILLECGALVIMVRQIIKAIIERKKTSA
jgi:hypothetical protein